MTRRLLTVLAVAYVLGAVLTAELLIHAARDVEPDATAPMPVLVRATAEWPLTLGVLLGGIR